MARKPEDNAGNADTTANPENEAATQLAQAERNATTPAQVESTAPPLRLGKANIPDEPVTQQTPILRTAFGVGDLAERGNPQGTIVLGDYKLGNKGDKLTVIPMGISFYYKENTQYIPGQRIEPRRLATASEVIDAGFTLDWSGPQHSRKQPDFQPAADLMLLIQQPEGVFAPYFSLTIGGNKYALARYYTDKNVYRFAGEPIVSTCQQLDNVFDASFEFFTAAKTLGRQNTTMPFTRLIGPTGDQVKSDIAKVLMNDSAEAKG